MALLLEAGPFRLQLADLLLLRPGRLRTARVCLHIWHALQVDWLRVSCRRLALVLCPLFAAFLGPVCQDPRVQWLRLLLPGGGFPAPFVRLCLLRRSSWVWTLSVRLPAWPFQSFCAQALVTPESVPHVDDEDTLPARCFSAVATCEITVRTVSFVCGSLASRALAPAARHVPPAG